MDCIVFTLAFQVLWISRNSGLLVGWEFLFWSGFLQNYDRSACHTADFIIPVLYSFYKSEPQFPSLVSFLKNYSEHVLDSY